MTARGETLVEVVVALLLLTVGAFALAAGIGEARRARSLAASSALALAAAEAWLETWRSGAPRGPGVGVERIVLGTWEAQLEWETAAPRPCVESARVAVTAVRGRGARVALSSRAFHGTGAGCGP